MAFRTVIVDESREDCVAVAFSDREAARLHALPLVRKRLVADGLLGEHPDLDRATLDELGEIDSAVLVLDEGLEGVWTGFISSDRWSTGGEFPVQPGEYLGNGDNTVYRTAVAPDGQEVAGQREDLPYPDEDDEQ